MTANCSNTTVYVGFTFFASCCPVGTLAGSEATRFLSEPGAAYSVLLWEHSVG